MKALVGLDSAETSILCKSKHYSYGNKMGRGGGQVVSVLTFYSSNPSSNPAGFENKWKRPVKANLKKHFSHI